MKTEEINFMENKILWIVLIVSIVIFIAA